MTPPSRLNSLAARDVAAVFHPYTDQVAHAENGPVVIAGGQGVRVTDDAGKSYIDVVAGLWCAALGFSNERLVKAAEKQMRALPFYHAFASKSHEPMIELSEMLLARAPVPMSRVFFCNSGSEANDTAVKMIWYYNNARGLPQKKKIISRIKAYHGVTVASASLTGLPYNHKSFDLPIAGILHTMTPHFYHGALPSETEEQFATRCADELEKLILAEGPETIAAMFAEPIMGAGGVLIPPASYFPKIQAVLKKYDILLVADEVICGFGRTGQYWGCQTLSVEPDILTCAKALSAAYLPISAVLVNAKVYDAISGESHKLGTFGHGYTYSGHPVAAAVAVETLKIYDELNILDHVREVGPYMQAELRRRFAEHPLVGEVRGTGLIAAVELVENKTTHQNFDPSRKVAARTAKHLEGFGVIGRPLPGDGLAFSPPLIITKSEIDEVLEAVEKALAAITQDLRAEGFSASA